MTVTASAPVEVKPSTRADLLKGFTSFGKGVADRLKESGIAGAGIDTLLTSVSNFLPANRDLPLTRIVEALVDPVAASSNTPAAAEADDFLTFDPKSARASGVGISARRGRSAYQEALVFVVGGGSSIEYSNLMEWAAKSSRTITYGSTELFNSSQWMKLLAEIDN